MSGSKVMLAVPHAGDIPGYFVDSLIGLIGATIGTHGILWNRVGNQPVDVARNRLARQALADQSVTHLFFMDADMTFPAGTLKRLLAHEKDIVSGLYFRRDRSPQPQLWEATDGRDPETGDQLWRAMGPEYKAWVDRFEWADGAGEPGIIPDDHPALADALWPVDGVGGGCLLISRHALERIGDPWFELVRNHGGGEDFDFCRKAKAAGLQVYADLAVQCGHEARGLFMGRGDFIATYSETNSQAADSSAA